MAGQRTTERARRGQALRQRRWAERRARLVQDDPALAAIDRQRRTRITRAWQARNPDKTRAHRIVCNEIRRGRMVRPDRCERCGAPGRPEASHDDYSRPLDVEWLCRPCHARKDRHLPTFDAAGRVVAAGRAA